MPHQKVTEDISGDPLTDEQREWVESVYFFCCKQAHKYCSRYPHLKRHVDDAAHQAVLGAMIAARKFDPERGAKFCSYAGHWIWQAIQRWHLRRKYEVGEPIAAIHRSGKCKRGHPFNAKNTYYRKSGPRKGQVAICRICKRESRSKNH